MGTENSESNGTYDATGGGASDTVLKRNRRRTLLDVPLRQGPTTVSHDLWNKHTVVKSLHDQTEAFFRLIGSKFAVRADNGAASVTVQTLILDAPNYYSTSFEFNQFMFLLKYLDMSTTVSSQVLTDYLRAKELFLKVDRKVKIFARTLAFMTTQCTYTEDLVVYRGMKDSRAAKVDDRTNFETLARISRIQRELQTLFKEEIDWVLIEFPDYQQAAKEHFVKIEQVEDLMQQLMEAKSNFDVQSRDLSSLVNGVGEQLTTEGFMSTSLSIEHARRFAGEHCCLLEIVIPKGTPCLYLTPFSAYSGDKTELEVVLPPCSQLAVVGPPKGSGGITRLRCLGISPVAQKRMDLGLDRLYLLADMYSKIKGAEFLDKKAISMNFGLRQICKKVDRPEHAKGKFRLTTFSDDVILDDWKADYSKKYSSEMLQG